MGYLCPDSPTETPMEMKYSIESVRWQYLYVTTKKKKEI